MIDRACLIAVPVRFKLIRRIANDYVELHIISEQLDNAGLDVMGVNESIGVGFAMCATVKNVPARPAKSALLFDPRMLHPLEPDVARVAGKTFGD